MKLNPKCCKAEGLRFFQTEKGAKWLRLMNSVASISLHPSLPGRMEWGKNHYPIHSKIEYFAVKLEFC